MSWHERLIIHLVRILSLGRASEIAPDEQKWPAASETPPAAGLRMVDDDSKTERGLRRF